MSSKPALSATIACCGLLHFRNYVEQLAESGILRSFLFSHRLSSFPNREWAFNFWAKEYIMHLLIRSVPDRLQEHLFPVLHDYWDWRAAGHLAETQLVHVMLHGTSRRVLRRAREQGSVIVGEAINTHPQNLYSVMNREYAACGIPPRTTMARQWQRLEQEIESCDWLLTPSPFVSRTYIERGFPANRIICIPYAANTKIFEPPSDWRHREVGPMSVVCVAQVIPRKGIHYLLQAWRNMGLPANQATLRIIGHIADNMAWITRGLPPGVEFIGTADRAGVIRELQAASVFVLPTLEEGFAVSILEAMSAGCAVVTTPASGAESIIINGQNGLIIMERDVDGLAESLCSLHVAPALRVKLGRAACETVQQKHNWTHYAEQVKAMYQMVVSTPARRALHL